MKIVQQTKETAAAETQANSEPLLSLLRRRTTADRPASNGDGVVVGELVGISEDGHTPFITFPRQIGTAAVAARSAVDLQGTHIGRQVVLLFEDADPEKPIIIGILRDSGTAALKPRLGTIDIDCDGERMIVEAKEQLVLRCGKARLTLTSAGKVVIEGTYISSRSSGVNRLKGGSVQIN
jgi:hypothetical protein